MDSMQLLSFNAVMNIVQFLNDLFFFCTLPYSISHHD